MPFFSHEHHKIREKYKTTNKARHWLTTLNTSSLSSNMITLIEKTPYFFLATSSSSGHTNVNYKGTQNKKAIHILDKKHLLFPDYEGNGIFHSLGDILSNPHIGILVINFTENKRIKINGKASIIDKYEDVKKYFHIFEDTTITRLIKVEILYAIENCSKNIEIVKNQFI